MAKLRKLYLYGVGLTLVLAFCFCSWNLEIAGAQIRPLTYPEISTALNNKRFPVKTSDGTWRNKIDVIDWLIEQIKKRKVDKPLTQDREDDLRQAGATIILIEAIRANSPPLPFRLPIPVTTPIPTPLPTPVKLLPMSELLKNAPKPGEVRKNSIGMELVFVPAGEFMMGSSEDDISESVHIAQKDQKDAAPFFFYNEKPQHRVKISEGFWMGRYEVTQLEYEKLTGTNPSKFKNCSICPVERVSWNDAKAFILQLNAKNDDFIYSLPTEEQWEYAARAGTTSLYGGAGSLDEMAWYKKNSGGKTRPVGQKQPNKFGLYDMHGNVFEWCEDLYGSYPGGNPTDLIGSPSGQSRVTRGGSFGIDASYSRSAARYGNEPSNRGQVIGFRVVARTKSPKVR